MHRHGPIEIVLGAAGFERDAQELRHLAGIMAESFLVEGRQDVENGCAATFGQSITDACLSWSDTETLLAMLAEAAQVRLDKQKA